MASFYRSMVWIFVFGFWVSALSGCGVDQNAYSITVSPAISTIGTNKTQRFFATVFDSQNNVISKTVTWSVSGDIGTIDSTGLFTAASAVSTGYVTATSDNVSGKAAVTLTIKGSISGNIKNSSGNNAESISITFTGPETLSATSNSSGNYSVSSAAYGTYEAATLENILYLSTTGEVFVTTGEASALNLTLTDRLSISDNIITTGTNITVTGTVTNRGTTTAKTVGVAYTFTYNDADGNPAVSVGSASVGDIASGAASAFSVNNLFPEIISYISVSRSAAATSY